jgi:NAD(P)-dependent dehydrogenase (short-subunit alcohol dehydrogenase family)
MQSVSLTGRQALVVGGTNGIGRGMCKWLAQHHASVVVAGRSKERGEEVIAEMKRLVEDKPKAPADAGAAAAAEGAPPTFSFAPIDSFLISDVRRFAKAFSEEHKRLDYLVISAGISSLAGRTETKEGLDQKLAIHYYTRIALIQALMPLLEATAAAGHDVRVMSVLSGGKHKPYKDYATDPELKKNFSLGNAANAAGFYNDIAVESLARDHPNLAFSHVSPGIVDTAWGSNFNPFMRGVMWVLKKALAMSPEQCASRISVALVDPAYKAAAAGDASGFHILAIDKPAKATALQATAREAVWKHTLEVLARQP